MRKIKQIQFNDLILKLKSVYTETERDCFEAEWRVFFYGLNDAEKKIAFDAFFNVIHENIRALSEVTLKLVDNNEITRQQAIDMTNELIAHPIFAKKTVISASTI